MGQRDLPIKQVMVPKSEEELRWVGELGYDEQDKLKDVQKFGV